METVIRVIVIYLFVLIGLRVVGKREFSQLSPMELVTLLLIPELVSQSLVREDFSLTNAIIAVCTLLSLVFLNSLLLQKSERMADIVEGKPALLVQHGKFIADNMNKERISPEELFAEMHQVGLYQLSQIKWAVLESDGRISFVPEEGQQGNPIRSVEKEIQ
ncbi:MAG: DUF421 domain-containing protein [Caldilinea sp. CFX5]|nr:DUF421 domain-containing protein [Caldilinea sp. CFX5]